ncbi:MAG: hypothetical protein LZF86_80124 [Nitrospira sp.]|nr:MAG: hypothetical protein LZF86_80124 [Nitrospira sp.]
MSAVGSGAIVLYRTESAKELIWGKGKYYLLPPRQLKQTFGPYSLSHFDSNRSHSPVAPLAGPDSSLNVGPSIGLLLRLAVR